MTARLDRVVIGNGAAAAEAVRALRQAGFSGAVDLFADGPHPPYNPMLGTWFAGGEIDRDDCFPFGGAEFYRTHGVRAHRGTPVIGLDPWARSLTTAAGDEFGYEECLVATGASTFVPPVPGLEGPAVFVLRTFDDARRLRAAVAAARERAAGGDPPRALVLGASFAGLEVARVLAGAGVETVVVELEPGVLSRAAHPVCARAVEDALRASGLELRLGVALSGVDEHGGRLQVRLGADRTDVVDLIVVCTGARPNLGLLAEAGVEVEDGLDIDESARAEAPGLLAAGDCARALDPVSGERLVVALWSNARLQGRTAGLTMAGVDARCPGGVPCNVQHVADTFFASGGSFAAADRVEVDERRGSVAVLGFSGRRLVGFNLFGDVSRAGPLARALGRTSCDLPARGCVSAAFSLAAVREDITWKTRSAS